MLDMFRAAVCALLVSGCAASESNNTAALEGHWTGQFEREGSALDVELAFTREGEAINGAFSAQSLRAAGIPLRDVRQDGEAAHFVLAGDATTSVFEGRLDGDRLAGRYTEGDAHGTFALARVATPPQACPEAPATFANGDVILSGSLLAPAQAGRAPAVLFIHGSGAEHRNASRFAAIALCRAGVAALIFDKRGVGQSTGDWRSADFNDLAGDAAAGLDWLAARPEIDPQRIGLYGHSQGGSIAPLVASRWTQLAFVVAGAGAGVRMSETERYSLRNAVSPLTRDDADRAEAFAFVDRVVETGATGNELDQLIASAARYADRGWIGVVQPPPREHFYWRFQRRIGAYDSTVHWRNVRAPVLLLYGAHDERVPVEPSIAAIRAALPSTTPVTVIVIEGADHGYMLRSSGEGFAWPRLAPQFPAALVEFAREQR